MTLDAHRRRLRQLARRRVAIEQQRIDAARAAHAAGLPIAAIAEALGLGRQHAHRLVHGRSDR